ncbi:MAG: hypothetical protein GKR89_19630 [Candidatus Latescibacteria bacterium]|nr:hypothetical protein [Candidatus Latescibacterota bacterium]
MAFARLVCDKNREVFGVFAVGIDKERPLRNWMAAAIGLAFLAGLAIGCGGADGQNPLDAEGTEQLVDAQLEAAVRAALEKPTGALSAGELSSLTRLDASGRRIAALGGIEQLQKLEVLQLANNQIRDTAPLAGLTRLATLDLGDNQVENLRPLAGLAQLRDLDLSNNSVQDISWLFGLARLQRVDLTGNPLDANSLDDLLGGLREKGVEAVFVEEVTAPEVFDFKIAYAAMSPDNASRQDIFVLGIAGTQAGTPLNLTQNPAGYEYPTWSPDGEWIAFVRKRTPGATAGDIYVMDAEGGNRRQISNLTRDYQDLSWAPDGTKIACVFERTFTTDVYAMDVEDGSVVRLTAHGDRANDALPQWSPDGTKIAFIRGLSRYTEIVDYFVMDADGGNPVNLTRNESAFIPFFWRQAPAWSADGSRLVFSSVHEGNRDIYVADAEGGNVRNLTNHPAEDSYPVWSADGSQIAFVRRQSDADGDSYAIYTMNANGGGLRQVTVLPDPVANPSWSPDGTRLVFSSVSLSGLFLAEVSGQLGEAVALPHQEGVVWWQGFSVAPW